MPYNPKSLLNLTSKYGFQKGKPAYWKGKKGRVAWNKGIKWDEETKSKISITKKGNSPAWNKGKEYPQIQGENHWKWKENRDELIKKNLRNDPLYKRWQSEVKRRDKICMEKDGSCCGYLIAHHIKSWKDYPELRYELDNGITLCQFHHYRKHGFKVDVLTKKILIN